ncbi:hypothetical protein CRG98_022915 [Punica granatum]|uniref:Uncharacterized protein n=1 Tax=Punica granatum TaxID=22663 RepID=A0A2I0JKA7_PUNGR|nr:hypothetical protein CRG98_022915 [Punica granatum]
MEDGRELSLVQPIHGTSPLEISDISHHADILQSWMNITNVETTKSGRRRSSWTRKSQGGSRLTREQVSKNLASLSHRGVLPSLGMRGKSRGSGKRVGRLSWTTRVVIAATGRKRGRHDSSDHGIEQGQVPRTPNGQI